jgi:2'-5' RNA ligase
MPRLFTAIEIPQPVALLLSLIQGGLPGARWIDRENLHITLRFVGDVETPVARELAYALERVKTAPFQLMLSGLDVFGGTKPRSLFAAVERSETLNGLYAEQERICQQIGLSPEGRKFKPHVTLARLRGARTADIAKYLTGQGGFSSPLFDVGRFVLLSSRNSVGGGPYVLEESYQLIEREAVHVDKI